MSTGDGIEADSADTADERPCVATSRTSPGRTVFVEEGNTDAWIATDVTVDLER